MPVCVCVRNEFQLLEAKLGTFHFYTETSQIFSVQMFVE